MRQILIFVCVASILLSAIGVVKAIKEIKKDCFTGFVDRLRFVVCVSSMMLLLVTSIGIELFIIHTGGTI